MATRNNRNRNQGRGGRGGGGGGGGDNKLAINAGISGKRNDCKIGVVLRRGRAGLPGERISFRFGSPDRPYGPWFINPTTVNDRYTITTNTEGEGETIAFDLSSDEYKPYTQVTVIYDRLNDPGRGIYEQVIQLPAPETVDGPTVAKKKNKRLIFESPTLPLRSPNNSYFLPPIRTVAGDGKTGEATDLIFTSTGPVTLIDKSRDAILTHNRMKADKKKYFAFKSPANGLLVLECRCFGTKRCKVTIMHVGSGEEASTELEFGR